MAIRTLPIAAALALAACSATAALDVLVESFRDGNIPAGYVDVSGGVQPGDTLRVSEEPFLDYLIPNNSGSAGVVAGRTGGPYIQDTTVSELTGGANSLANPDRFQVVFEWSDGEPLPFGADHYGVSWGGWSASETASLTTRIQFPDTDPVRIYHWFNDGWNYANHDLLEGHNLTVTLYDSGGTPREQFTEVLPSGGAEDIFGDHRQFYTARIDVSGHAAGDFLIIRNEGGNVGFRGMAVSRGEAAPDPALQYAEGQWGDDPRFGPLFGLGGGWVISPAFGVFHDRYPWIYSPRHGWLLDPRASVIADGLYLMSPDLGPLWVTASRGGWFWIHAESRWERF
jgi:hypothetical protein